jgi:hypothetical protein
VSGAYLPDNYIVGNAYTSFTTSACTVSTLSVTNSPQTYTGSSIPAVLSCSSGGSVSNVLYSGNAAVPSAAGTYAITADCSANGSYSALTGASAGNFVISPGTPTLSVTNSPQTYTGSSIPAVLSCSSGGSVSNVLYSGNAAVPSAAGTYAITADCSANGNYSAVTAASAGSFQIVQATQTLTLSPPSATVNAGVAQSLTLSGVTGTGQVTYSLSSSGSVTCAKSNESSSSVTVTGSNGSGSCTVTASIAADNNYQSATSNQSILSVNLTPQTGFTLNLSSTSVTTGTPVNLSTTGGQGNGQVTYTAVVQPQGQSTMISTSNKVVAAAALQCSLSGSILTPTGGPGVCEVTATKAADGDYAEASSIADVTVTVPPPAPNPIPTLSEWAQMMMMLAMIATAGFYGWRMKQR